MSLADDVIGDWPSIGVAIFPRNAREIVRAILQMRAADRFVNFAGQLPVAIDLIAPEIPDGDTMLDGFFEAHVLTPNNALMRDYNP